MTTNRRAILLAFATIAGLIGMFVVDGALDWVFFALAVLPLAWGAARFVAQRDNIQQP